MTDLIFLKAQHDAHQAHPPALRVVYEGHTDGVRYGSWALVNRRLQPFLRGVPGLDLTVVEPGGWPDSEPPWDVWLSHYYPGLEARRGFRAPPAGARAWVPWVAWEVGACPPDWARAWREAGAREVWACSAHARRLLLASTALDPARVRAVPYGVDCAVFAPRGETWPTKGDHFRVLYVGGEIPRKGVDLAIEAYCRAFTEAEPTRLVIKAQGRRSFYAQAPAVPAPEGRRDWQVVASDAYSDEQMAALYRSCDVLVAPYRAEGFCLPILEAMACGVPVVYPAHGPAPAYVPQEAGICVPSHRGEPDVEAVARALRWLWAHPDERRAMGQAGRAGSEALDWRPRASAVWQALRYAAVTDGTAFTPPAGVRPDPAPPAPPAPPTPDPVPAPGG